MAVLQVGRVGVDADIDMISGFRESSGRGGDEGHQIEINGFIKSSTLANTNAIRTELLATADYGSLIPVTWSEDPTVDGWYYLQSVSVDGAAQTRSLSGSGFYGFSLTLIRLGGAEEVNFQSKFTGNVLTNDKSIVDGSTQPYWALPDAITHWDGLTTGGGASLEERESADGVINFFSDMQDRTDAPTWAIAPSDYYLGAARILTNGITRGGYHVGAGAEADWELSNGLVRLRDNGSNLDMGLGVYDGSVWDADKTFKVRLGGATHWNRSRFSILRNDPECCAVRIYGLIGLNFLTFDLQVRRGSHFITGYFKTGTSGGIVHFYLDEAGTETSTYIQTNAATNGNDYFVATASGTRSAATTKVQGTANSIAFGAEINTATVATPDTMAELELQYLGWITERVTPLRA